MDYRKHIFNVGKGQFLVGRCLKIQGELYIVHNIMDYREGDRVLFLSTKGGVMIGKYTEKSEAFPNEPCVEDDKTVLPIGNKANGNTYIYRLLCDCRRANISPESDKFYAVKGGVSKDGNLNIRIPIELSEVPEEIDPSAYMSRMDSIVLYEEMKKMSGETMQAMQVWSILKSKLSPTEICEVATYFETINKVKSE